MEEIRLNKYLSEKGDLFPPGSGSYGRSRKSFGRW